MNPLLENELEEVEIFTGQDRDQFKIDNISALNWALRKLSALEAKRKEVNQLADEEVSRIESYRKSELDKLQHSVDFFNSLIAEYAIKRKEEDPNFKSEKTPYGRIGFRKQQPKWEYDDEKVVEFLQKNDYWDLIRIKKEPVKTEVKKLFTPHSDGNVYDENGQVVEGITVTEQPEKLDVKVE